MLTKEQEMSSQMPLRKSLWRKDACLNRFLMQMKMSYSGEKKFCKRYLLVKKKKRVPGFKAGRARLTVWFCANAAGCMIWTALSIKLLTHKLWREKMNSSCQSFGCTIWRRPGQQEFFYWIGFIRALSLESGSTSPARDYIFKFFWD